MNACVLHAIADLRHESAPDPTPRRGEVVVRVGGCGVCGSDIPRVFTKGTYRFPLIPGHEFAGTVEALGDGVDPVWRGRRVAVFPLIPCMRCGACATGDYQLCEDYDYLGSRRDGAFAEYVCAPVWNLQPVPDAVSLEEAAMTEPTAVAIHAMRRGGLEAGDRVLILGAGPIGLLAALWAKAAGAGRVVIGDIDAPRLEFAEGLGAGETVNVTSTGAVDELRNAFDLAVEAAGAAPALAHCIQAACRKGRVVLLGNPAGAMTLPAEVYSAAMRKELTLSGTWNSSYGNVPRNDWAAALNAMASKHLQVVPLITHRVGLEELPSALAMLRDRTTPAAKVMCVP